jgi:signal transduction histidine kinase
MARNIVQEHGGKLWLESQPGNGTTVFLELPLAMVETVRGGSTP